MVSKVLGPWILEQVISSSTYLGMECVVEEVSQPFPFFGVLPGVQGEDAVSVPYNGTYNGRIATNEVEKG